MPDDLGYHLSHTRKLGDDIKKFIDKVKLFTALLPQAAQIAALIGGVLLVGYAVKEHFFYDLSSIAPISLLFITFFAFSFFLITLVIYSFLITLWIAVAIHRVISWTVVYVAGPLFPGSFAQRSQGDELRFHFSYFYGWPC